MLMQRTNLRAVDLNLLVVFDAVMAERSVTRAAGRLRLTQPAVSHALSRLRALFHDPLFVRTPAGLEPTPAAARLAGRIAAVLADIGNILAPSDAFDPAASDRRFIVGMSDYAAYVVLPELSRRLHRLAPRSQLVVRHTSHVQGLAMLDDGDVELIVGNFPKAPHRMHVELLFKDGFVCAARRRHPALAKRLDLETYLAQTHLQVSLRGEPAGYVDEVLGRGRRRRVALTIGHFLLAPSIIAATDLVATEPERLLRPEARRHGLVLQPPPFPIPQFEVTQVWPRRFAADPAHAWLRMLLAAVSKVSTAASEGSRRARGPE
jgi:DNA-binding transcriptional LysR family regulator